MLTCPPSISRSRKLAIAALRDSSVLRAVANQSYRHPNGFSKVVLEGSALGGGVRLHHWPSDDGFARTYAGEDAHSHRWDFASVVICGQFSEVLYDVERGTDFVSYSCTRRGLRNHLENPRPVSLQVLHSFEFGSGERITRHAKVVHKLSRVGCDSAITLVRTKPPTKPHSLVVRSHSAPRDADSSRGEPVSPYYLRRLLDEFLSRSAALVSDSG